MLKFLNIFVDLFAFKIPEQKFTVMKVSACIFLLFYFNRQIGADFMTFVKIEACNSTNLTLAISRCDIVDGKLNLVYTYTKPMTQAKEIKFF